MLMILPPPETDWERGTRVISGTTEMFYILKCGLTVCMHLSKLKELFSLDSRISLYVTFT